MNVNMINSVKVLFGDEEFYIKVASDGSDAIVYDRNKLSIDDDAQAALIYKYAAENLAGEVPPEKEAHAFMLAFLGLYNTLKSL